MIAAFFVVIVAALGQIASAVPQQKDGSNELLVLLEKLANGAADWWFRFAVSRKP